MSQPLLTIKNLYVTLGGVAILQDLNASIARGRITALIGLWFPDLQANKPSFFDSPLTGTVEKIAAAMRGYAELGVQHIMFQCEPYSIEARRLLTEALQLYRGRGQQ